MVAFIINSMSLSFSVKSLKDGAWVCRMEPAGVATLESHGEWMLGQFDGRLFPINLQGRLEKRLK